MEVCPNRLCHFGESLVNANILECSPVNLLQGISLLRNLKAPSFEPHWRDLRDVHLESCPSWTSSLQAISLRLEASSSLSSERRLLVKSRRLLTASQYKGNVDKTERIARYFSCSITYLYTSAYFFYRSAVAFPSNQPRSVRHAFYPMGCSMLTHNVQISHSNPMQSASHQQPMSHINVRFGKINVLMAA